MTKKDEEINENFIREYYIPEILCDHIIEYYHNNKEQQEPGLCGAGIAESVKKSTDITINARNDDYPFNSYKSELSKCLEQYKKTFSYIDMMWSFGLSSFYNIQHYLPNEGFYKLHTERNGSLDSTIKRLLVFMTYLNDVEDGGTEFPHFNKIVKAKKGKTLIWPSDWTHAHKGQVSTTKEKMIVTGWYVHYWD